MGKCASRQLFSYGGLVQRALNEKRTSDLGPIYTVSGTRDSPPPALPWPRYLLAYFFANFNQPYTFDRIQLGWASCLASSDRVALASGTTFLYINALARLTGTTPGVASVT